MKVLFITELYPAPNKGGEYLRTNGLVKMLKNSGYDFYAVFGYKGKIKPDIDLPKEKFTFFDFNILNVEGRIKGALQTFKKHPKLINCIDNILSDFKPDFVFIDYHYFGQYIPYLRKKGIPVIYGTHNIQSIITLQFPDTSSKDKLIRKLVYRIFQFHEKFFFKKANAIITVSENDSEYYSSFSNKDNVFCIPNFIDIADYKTDDPSKQNYIIMPANFGAYQNKVGLEWFLENVWDSELEKLTRFIIIGRFSDKVFAQLSENKNYQNIEALGEVDNIKPYISRAKIAIVPLLHGSGTRLKCIEAMALKTQIISTTVGAEGIEHEGSIIIADNPNDFKDAIIKAIKENIDYTKNAYSIFENKYSLNNSIKIFNKIVTQIIPKENPKRIAK
jgi:hypothetical protein